MKEYLAQFMPPDYSQHGPQLDQLNAWVHWLMLILFIGWGLLFIFMLVRFRKSNHPKASYHGTKSHLSTWVEFAVFAAECVLLFGISIPAWSSWTTRPAKEENPLEIRVVGEQFAWNIHYPGPDGVFGRTDLKLVAAGTNPLGLDVTDPAAKDDIITLNQMRLEVNRPVIVRISSKDVIHSFFLPYMRVKQDATPGMEVPIHFTPTHVTPGGDVWGVECKDPQCQTWDIGCAQLCGIGHYKMKGQYKVHSKEDFAKWMATEKPAANNISG